MTPKQQRKLSIKRIYANLFKESPHGLRSVDMCSKIVQKIGFAVKDTKDERTEGALVKWCSWSEPSLLKISELSPKFSSKKRRRKLVTKAKADRPKKYAENRAEFYASWEWRTLRKEVLNQYGARCQCCGATPADVDIGGKPVRIVVDHIKPLAKYWELRLDRTNLQILCDECNQGAGSWDETDHRPTAETPTLVQ